MASNTGFGWNSFIVRLVFAIVVVFSTYNPEGASYYHWVADTFPSMTVGKALVGVILLIGWVILIRSTLGALGAIGIVLAVAFFGLLIWFIIDILGLDTQSFRAVSYIVQLMIASLLSIGVSWSHIRRRISGQLDTDEIERDL